MIDLAKEKILCLIVVDDKISELAHGERIPAYLRAFVLQDRQTGDVYAMTRFKQADGSRRWTKLQKDGHTADDYCKEIEAIFHLAIKTLNYEGDNPVSCFYPPKELGPMESIEWMEKMNLIEVTKVPVEEKPGGDAQ